MPKYGTLSNAALMLEWTNEKLLLLWDSTLVHYLFQKKERSHSERIINLKTGRKRLGQIYFESYPKITELHETTYTKHELTLN